jgi:hypothetical protein
MAKKTEKAPQKAEKTTEKKPEKKPAEKKQVAKTGKAATSVKAKVATKKTAPKKPAGEKKPKITIKTTARHPKARVLEAHGGKEALAKSVAALVARGDQDTDALATELKTASNSQLLRLHEVSETVKKKWGNRDKLIAAIGAAENKGKDKDYLTKLETYSLPHLVELATAAERRARA